METPVSGHIAKGSSGRSPKLDRRLIQSKSDPRRTKQTRGRGVPFDMESALWLLPIVGGFIGWVTNVIAIHMLFRPRQPVRVPFTSLTLQGVLPRRHAELADSIGRTVSEELLPMSELMERLDVAGMKAQVVAAVAQHVERKLDSGVSRLLPPNLRAMLASYLRDVVAREAEEVMDGLMAEFSRRAGEQINVEQLVSEKVRQLDLVELESLAHRLAGRELRAVVVLGGVFGFVIGLLQMLVIGVLLPAL